MAARLPDDETARLATLHEHRILDTAPEAEFDDLVRLAANICGVPIAAVSLIDTDRQWFKAITGLDVAETPRDAAFCAHAILQSDVMIVPDARADARFADNPLVTGDPSIRFYAGAPLVSESGHALGSLCVIDRVPRTLTSEQQETLRLLARQVSSHLRAARRMAERENLLVERENLLRVQERLAAERERVEARRREAEEKLAAEREFTRALLESLQEGIVACDADGALTLMNRAMREMHDLPERELSPGEWAAHFALFQADGLTPMETAQIPLFRALHGEMVRDAELVIAPHSHPMRNLIASGQPIYGPGGEKLGAVAALRDVTERHQAEREIARLAAIVEYSEEAILATTLDGIFVSWNKGAERLYGRPASEMIGRHSSVLVSPDQKSPVPAAIQRLRQGESVPPLEELRTRDDGTTFYASLSFSPICDASGLMVGLSCVARDITARKRAEAALAKSEARLAEAQHIAGVGSWEFDLVENKITWSNELFRLFGLNPADGEPDYARAVALYHPEDTPVLDALVTRAAEQGIGYELDLRGAPSSLPGGLTRWYHTVGTAISDESGRVVRLLGTLADITERKQLEANLREQGEQRRQSEAALRAVLESAPVILYAADANGVVTLSEGTGLTALGLTPGEAVGRSVFEFSGGDAGIDNKTRRALAGEALSYDAHVFGLCLHTEVRPLRNADGSPAGIIGVCMDVTERMRAEESVKDYAIVLEFQKKELEHANAELASLATTDGLTGLKNHRAFQERLAEEFSRFDRYGPPLSLIILDVDHFKAYNDAYGHPAGDTILKSVAQILQDGARETDLAARYGGEEFVVLLPQTDADGAAAFAERLRAAVESYIWPIRAVTASFGVASLRLGDKSGADVIARADDALYRSKATGRNRVTGSHTEFPVPILETEFPPTGNEFPPNTLAARPA